VAAEAPTEPEYVPVPQFVQVITDVAPAAVENFPATQSSHVAAALAPTEVEYFPDPQMVQAVTDTAPVLVENFPALHS